MPTLRQKYNSSYLTRESFNNRLDLATILIHEQNPIEQFDRQKLVDTTRSFVDTLQYINLNNYPSLANRHTQGSSILYSEFGNFLIQSGYGIDRVQEIIENTVPYVRTNSSNNTSLPNSYKSLLDRIEIHYNHDNISNTVTGGFCSAFFDPFRQVLNTIAQIQLARDLITVLQNFSFDDLYNQMEFLKDRLLDIVSVILINEKRRLILNSSSNFVRNVQRKYADAQNFCENLSIEAIQSQIERFVEQSIAQFEELTPEAIALLLFRFCQFADLIQSFIQKPGDAGSGGCTAQTVLCLTAIQSSFSQRCSSNSHNSTSHSNAWSRGRDGNTIFSPGDRRDRVACWLTVECE